MATNYSTYASLANAWSDTSTYANSVTYDQGTSSTITPYITSNRLTIPIDDWNAPITYKILYTTGTTASETTLYNNSEVFSTATEMIYKLTNVVYSSTDIENYVIWPGISKQSLLKEKLRHNLSINIKSRSNSQMYPGENEPERKALETLREIVTELEFRKYLRYGFVLVKGKSGATYQIFCNQSHCRVWLNGRMIEEICIRIKDELIPKTDKIIALKTIIETSEEEFKKLGNVYKMAA